MQCQGLHRPTSGAPIASGHPGRKSCSRKRLADNDENYRRPVRTAAAKRSEPSDLFSIGQSLFDVGAQTLQKVGRQFEARPAGFPPGPSGRSPITHFVSWLLLLHLSSFEHTLIYQPFVNFLRQAPLTILLLIIERELAIRLQPSLSWQKPGLRTAFLNAKKG